MLFLNNAFTKDITEYDGEVLKEVKTVDGKIYLSNGAIIKEGVVGKFFDIATNDKYGTVFEADGPDEIGPIVGFAPVTGDSAPDYFAYMLRTTAICVKLNANKEELIWKRFFQSSYSCSESKAVSRRNSLQTSSVLPHRQYQNGKTVAIPTAIYCLR